MTRKTEAIYSDKDRNLTTAEQASFVEITEYDKNGRRAKTSYGCFTEPTPLREMKAAFRAEREEYEIVMEIERGLTGDFDLDSKFIMDIYEKYKHSTQIKKILENLFYAFVKIDILDLRLLDLSRFFRNSINGEIE